MAENAIAPDRPHAGLLNVVILAGVCGGALDFIDASLSAVASGKSMLRPWQGIAGVWFRRLPDTSDLPAAALGVATHFAIAIVMAAVLAVAMSRIPGLRRRPVLGGLAYGAGLYLVMLGIVMPLIIPGRFFLWNGVGSLHGIAVHLAVGLVMAMVLSWGLKPGGLRPADGLPGR